MLVRALLVLFFGCAATSARADVIDPSAPRRVCPPMACPPGSHPVGGGHSGCPSECGAPTACDDEHPCPSGSLCTPEPESLCIESVSFGNYEASVRRGACVEAACPAPQVCWTGRYCIDDPAPAASSPSPSPPPPVAPTSTAPASTPSPSGLCSASVGPTSPWALVAIAALVAIVLRARR